MSAHGMIRNEGYGGAGELWIGMKPEDMRPKEEFGIGYLVDCIDRPLLHDGTILQFDADFHLAQVEWSTGHVGWWYLKDLVVVGYPTKNQVLFSHRGTEITKKIVLEKEPLLKIAEQLELAI